LNNRHEQNRDDDWRVLVGCHVDFRLSHAAGSAMPAVNRSNSPFLGCVLLFSYLKTGRNCDKRDFCAIERIYVKRCLRRLSGPPPV
jgi:hypothetical protein